MNKEQDERYCVVCCAHLATYDGDFCSEHCAQIFYDSKSKHYADNGIDSCYKLFDFMFESVRRD